MELTDATLLVTGGAGFVGSHLCERLVADNEVRVVDDCSNGDRSWVPEGVEVVEGDLREESVLDRAVTPDLDGVFHFAADKAADRDDLSQFRLNNALTEALVGRMDEVGVRNVAFTSSSTVYGEAPRPPPRTSPRSNPSASTAHPNSPRSRCSRSTPTATTSPSGTSGSPTSSARGCSSVR